MSKEDVKKLRRDVEILKAQLAGKSTAKKPSKPEKGSKKIKQKEKEQPTMVKEGPTGDYVRKDLKRSLIITAGILTLITTLYLTQSHWQQITLPF